MTLEAVTGARPSVLPASLSCLNPVVVGDLVRLGGRLDGGYVVSRPAIVAADALVSFGLGLDWTFESGAVQLNPALAVHVYDHSVSERNVLDSGSKLHESYRDFFQGRRVHYRERVCDRATREGEVTPDRIFARVADRNCLLIKMDIEGAEYRVLDALLAHQSRILLMVIEFHATEFLRKVFLKKIDALREHFELIHLHGNNYVGLASDGLPDVLEITFLRKSLCKSSQRRDRLPLAGLDWPNDPAKTDYELLFA